VKRRLRALGIEVPLVADIHFSPAAAMEAAEHVEKVRVNPGNFADQSCSAPANTPTRTMRGDCPNRGALHATGPEVPAAWRGDAHRVEPRLTVRSHHEPLTAIHPRHGGTALEFVRIARKHDYHEIVLSMKASNPKVMIQAYRLLVARMDEEGLDAYPLHLGVTEAGLGEDGRIKSAVGIGALLDDGLGDTVRVSLTRNPKKRSRWHSGCRAIQRRPARCPRVRRD